MKLQGFKQLLLGSFFNLIVLVSFGQMDDKFPSNFAELLNANGYYSFARSIDSVQIMDENRLIGYEQYIDSFHVEDYPKDYWQNHKSYRKTIVIKRTNNDYRIDGFSYIGEMVYRTSFVENKYLKSKSFTVTNEENLFSFEKNAKKVTIILDSNFIELDTLGNVRTFYSFNYDSLKYGNNMYLFGRPVFKYYLSGKLKELYYENSNYQASGTYKLFYENGNIAESGNYEIYGDSSVKSGAWIYYNESGLPFKKETYQNGQLINQRKIRVKRF